MGHLSRSPLPLYFPWRKDLRSRNEKAHNWVWLPHLKHLYLCLCNSRWQKDHFLLKYTPCLQEAVLCLRQVIYTSTAHSRYRRVLQCRKGTPADPTPLSTSAGMRCSFDVNAENVFDHCQPSGCLENIFHWCDCLLSISVCLQPKAYVGIHTDAPSL